MGKNVRQFHLAVDDRMFDFSGFYERIAESLPDGAVIAEVGVANGASAIYLAEAMLNRNKHFTFYLIDSLAYGGADQLRGLLKNLSKANLFDWVEVLPYSSLEAACRFPDGHFDFVFIDASHKYEWTKADIRLWYTKIKELGILAGHDYNDGPEGKEVKQAVDEVIPMSVTRTDIPDCIFEPENVLSIEKTTKGCGVWSIRKKWYVRLNQY